MRASGETHGKCQIDPNIKYPYFMSFDFISRFLLFTLGMAKLDLMMEHKDTHEFLIACVWPFPKGDMIILILHREISRMGCANPGLIIPDHFPWVLYRPIPLIQQTTCMDLGSPVHLGFYSSLLNFPTTLPQTNLL